MWGIYSLISPVRRACGPGRFSGEHAGVTVRPGGPSGDTTTTPTKIQKKYYININAIDLMDDAHDTWPEAEDRRVYESMAQVGLDYELSALAPKRWSSTTPKHVFKYEMLHKFTLLHQAHTQDGLHFSPPIMPLSMPAHAPIFMQPVQSQPPSASTP